MNIQFMTKEKNGIPTGEYDRSGKQIYLYMPDIEEMVANASCKEEIIAIENMQNFFDAGLFNGFSFEIVYTDIDRHINPCTDESSWTWQVLQHPWYEGWSKEDMIKEIIKIIELNQKLRYNERW